jgi:hypothetical protein
VLPYIKNKTINFCVKKGSVSSVWAHHKILAQKGHSAYGNILVSLTCCNMFESRNDKITRPNSRDLIIKSSYAKRDLWAVNRSKAFGFLLSKALAKEG